MRIYIIVFYLLLSANMISAQKSDYELWSYETNGRIYSNPLIEDNTIYFGSNDNTFYAISADNGSEVWQYEVNDNIQSGSAIKDSLIFFESGNSCYALNKNTGEEMWVYVNNDPQGAGKLDDWDYHHATPVVDDTIVYFGCGNGMMLGIDIFTGTVKVQVSSIDSVPIRSTPAINNGIIYFGDWDGRAYAYDIIANDTIWTRRTYSSQPYSTFGMLNTKMLVHDSLLIMGARNPRIYALNIYTGEIEWSYLVGGGGWISGDPYIENDILYIGGSDCHKLFAIDVHTGNLNWDYVFLQNNFSQPIICGDYVVFTTGNAYANGIGSYGSGYLYVVNKHDGSLKNYTLVGGNIFTTPVIHNGQIIVGSDDHNIYALDSLSFITNLNNNGTATDSMDPPKHFPNPFRDSIRINYSVSSTSSISVIIYDMSGTEICKFNEGEMKAGEYSIIWNGKDMQENNIPAGIYIVEIISKTASNRSLIIKQ